MISKFPTCTSHQAFSNLIGKNKEYGLLERCQSKLYFDNVATLRTCILLQIPHVNLFAALHEIYILKMKK